MTDIFIYVYFAVMTIFDIFLYIRKEKTITSFMQKWYASTMVVPYAAGVVFCGHFVNAYQLDMVKWKSSLALAATGVIFFGLTVIQRRHEYLIKPRILILIPIAAGYVLGDLFW